MSGAHENDERTKGLIVTDFATEPSHHKVYEIPMQRLSHIAAVASWPQMPQLAADCRKSPQIAAEMQT